MSNPTPTSTSLVTPVQRKTFLPETPRVHIGLFFTTFTSIMFVYLVVWGGGSARTMGGSVIESFVFACALLLILLSHELGHYLAARVHGIDATLPYFIPAPIGIGTFGAFIQIKQKLHNKRQLLDVGVAGPLAGMAMALLLAIGGIYRAQFLPLSGAEIVFGESLLFKGIIFLVKGPVPEGMDLALNPIEFAAWLGFLVTALNLMPASQLDGGHIVYSLLGNKHRYVSRLVFLSLVLWGCWGDISLVGAAGIPTCLALTLSSFYLILTRQPRKLFRWLLFLLIAGHITLMVVLEVNTQSSMWLFWGGLLFMFGLDHPPTRDEVKNKGSEIQLDIKRKLIGAFAMILFVLTFMPQPIELLQP